MAARNTDPGFVLDPAFTRDCYVLGDLPLCRALLMNDARYTWFILIPRRSGIVEIIDLLPEDRRQLLDEVVIASDVLKTVVAPDKINVGALGNMVPQLHVHVIARFRSDPAWPGPVWGHSPAAPYPAHGLGVATDRLLAAFHARGLAEVAE
ncbi:MAG: HIT domain-containing protein [Proteobacteria bacterium]|nr:HIT domain-containing protein [Pseudomonadota bacterium]